MPLVSAALFFFASVALGQNPPPPGAAQSSLGDAADQNRSVVLSAADPKGAAGQNFDGNPNDPRTVVAGADGKPTIKTDVPLQPSAPETHLDRSAPPPPAASAKKPGEVSAGLMMGGAAALGGLQGWFAGGMLGLASGAGLGLAAAWMFHKGDYGAAFGITAGAIVGTALGGPIGGLAGAVLGGLAGHFLGKVFFPKAGA